MDHEAVECAHRLWKQPVLVHRSPHGRLYLCLSRFRRLLTISHGGNFSEATMAAISKGLGLDRQCLGFFVRGAGGAGSVANGRFTQQGTCNGRPIYWNEHGLCMFFSSFWKIGERHGARFTWLYALKDATGPRPPIGQWTTYGYTRSDAEPAPEVEQGQAPDAVPCDTLFAWLIACQTQECGNDEGITLSQARLNELPEKDVFDELVKLSRRVDFQATGGSLVLAPPGIFASTAPCAPSAWLVRAVGTGDWTSSCGSSAGPIRLAVDTDAPSVALAMGGEALEVRAATIRHFNRGASVRVALTAWTQAGGPDLEPDCAVQVEMTLHGSGAMQGWYQSAGLQLHGTIQGRSDGEFRPHDTECPEFESESAEEKLRAPGSLVSQVAAADDSSAAVSPAWGLTPKELLEKHQAQPTQLLWETPEAVTSGRVRLVGIAGPPRSGKTALAAWLAEAVFEREVRTAVVGQETYSFEDAVNRDASGLLLTPAFVRWSDFVDGVDAAVASVAKLGTVAKPGIVVIEGPLVYWMEAVHSHFALKFFLRSRREEVLRRLRTCETGAVEVHDNDAPLSSGRASRPTEAFLEHVVWPSHLMYGQPCPGAREIEVPESHRSGPLPRDMMDRIAGEVLQAFKIGSI